MHIAYMKVMPLNGKVIFRVETEGKEERTTSGILLVAKETEEKRNIGTVMAVAPDVENVSVNDIIVVDKYNSLILTEETGYNLYVVDESDIFGKVGE